MSSRDLLLMLVERAMAESTPPIVKGGCGRTATAIELENFLSVVIGLAGLASLVALALLRTW